MGWLTKQAVLGLARELLPALFRSRKKELLQQLMDQREAIAEKDNKLRRIHKLASEYEDTKNIFAARAVYERIRMICEE